jgi:hypothetical protein
MLEVVDMDRLVATRATPATLDLSVPAPGEESSSQAPVTNQRSRGSEQVGASGIRTEGFGNEVARDDGSWFCGAPVPARQEVTEVATEAWSKVVDVLPDQVKQYVKAPEEEGRAGNATAGAAGLGMQAGSTAPAVGLEAEYKSATVSRACEGKWVPTYMRQQLAAGGHTELPKVVNAHEYHRDKPPPSVAGTFRDMGEEVHENAQAMLAYVVAFLSTLALQCQMCSQSTATTVHESAETFSITSLCSQVATVETGDDDKIFDALPDEASAGLGPMRSRVQRTMQGVRLENVVDIVKTKLVTRCGPPGSHTNPNLPPALQRLVKARELVRQVVDRMGIIESFYVNTEANIENLPPEAVQLLGVPSPLGGKLSFRERWRVDHCKSIASVELSNEHVEQSQVIVSIRLDITDRPELPGVEADSRLYIKPRSHGAVMPLGLVERLTEMHHVHSESLRDAVLSLAGDMDVSSGPNSAVAAAMPVSASPAQAPAPRAAEKPSASSDAQWPPALEKRPWSTQDDSCLKEKLQAHPAGSDISLDKSLLLQVADGI